MTRWLLDNAHAIVDSWKRTKVRPTQFIILVTLLGILLAIPGWLAQIWLGMQSLVPDDAIHSEILVFLNDEVDIEARIELERLLQDDEIIQWITFIPKNDALKQLSEADGLSGISTLFDQNPLPDAFRVRFIVRAGGQAEESVIRILQSDNRIQSLKYYPSSRVQYSALIDALGLIGLAFSTLTVGGVLMAVFLVSAADVMDDRRRIELYTLLGASDRYIKRPYLYRATLMGILSGSFSCLVVVGVNEVLSTLLVDNLRTLNSELVEIPINGQIMLGLGFVAILASWIGAERAVSRHLESLH